MYLVAPQNGLVDERRMSRWIFRGSLPSCARLPILLGWLAGMVLFGLNRPARAESPTTVAEIVDLRFRTQKQRAKSDVAEWELHMVRSRPPKENHASPAARRLIGEALSTAVEKASKAAIDSEPNPELVATWKQAESRRVEFQSAILEREVQYGFDWANGTPPPFKLVPLDFAILIWAGLAFLISCLMAIHELRRSIRRSSRSRLPGGIAASILATGLLFTTGCQGPASGGTPSSQFGKKAAEDALAESTAQAERDASDVNGRYVDWMDAWAKFLAPDDEPRQQQLKDKDGEFLRKLRAAAERAALESRLAEDVATVAAQEADEAKLEDLTRSAVWWSMVYAAGRTGVALVLGVLAVLPFLFARRRAAAARKVDSRTCPRCLAVGKLEVHSVPRNGGGEYTESTYLECKACEYRMARSHQHVPRLCFPTVGIRAGGKTHMLTTAYASIQNRFVPSRAAIQPAPSVMDERFRQYIELILRYRGEAGGTIHDTAYLDPLLIHARDTDRWGPNGVLVNLFDYSGELVEETPLAQDLRPRAMHMDGFMMIFDPTQIYGEGGVTLEDQVRALANFYNQMAEARGLPPGTMIPNPVAVCITKFDLLESSNPIGGQCLPFIKQLDGALKPVGTEPVTLAMLKARSDLVEQMLPLMFPGVDLGRLVREYFGTQMLFFPMSSVNLNVDEFGRVDPMTRNPSPYGVVEPILWLMHMHGYCVFD
jgi:hypothetical protein